MNSPLSSETRPLRGSAVAVVLVGLFVVGLTIAGAGLVTALQEDNSPPSVELGEDQTVNVGETLTFQPTATDADGEVVGFAWRVDGVLVSREDTLEYTFREPGEFEIEVTAYDDDDATATDTIVVTVNEPPSAEIEVTSTDANTLDFAGNATDPDGEVDSYEWRVDGEVVSSEETFTHTFESAGDHLISLTVTDDAGAETTVETSVQVEMPTEDGGGGGSIPGFGVAIGLAAIVIGVALIAHRRV